MFHPIYLITSCLYCSYTSYQRSVYRTVPMLPQFLMTLPEQCLPLPDNRKCRLVTDLGHILFSHLPIYFDQFHPRISARNQGEYNYGMLSPCRSGKEIFHLQALKAMIGNLFKNLIAYNL